MAMKLEGQSCSIHHGCIDDRFARWICGKGSDDRSRYNIGDGLDKQLTSQIVLLHWPVLGICGRVFDSRDSGW